MENFSAEPISTDVLPNKADIYHDVSESDGVSDSENEGSPPWMVFKRFTWKCYVRKDFQSPKMCLYSPQLQFRGAMLKQLIHIHKTLNNDSIVTLHLAVYLLDMFMDNYALDSDKLMYVIIACYSLAVKGIEKVEDVPTLSRLAAICQVEVSGPLLRCLEWKVGVTVDWAFHTPTIAYFALFLKKFLVTSEDASQCERTRLRAYTLLIEYLYLVLTDVRLQMLNKVECACACVACVREELGFAPWPAAFTEILKVTTADGRTIPTNVGIAVFVRLLRTKRMQERALASSQDTGGLKRCVENGDDSDCVSPKRYRLS